MKAPAEETSIETLTTERSQPGLMVITLDRPEKLNAINNLMHEELQETCRQLQLDYETRVVIFTGAGRAFSAGADLTASRSPRMQTDEDRPSVAAERVRAGIGNITSQALENLDQLTIAAINGLAIGGAVVFASCMDIRFAAESAWFSIPEVDLAIPLTWNALPRLVRELGPARTKELVISCDRFSSQQALDWGFLNRVVPDGELMEQAVAFAERVLQKNDFAVRPPRGRLTRSRS